MDDTLSGPDLSRDRAEPCMLLARFESLGGSGHGSEFAVAQAHFGVSADGLLAWADWSHDLLVSALDAGLDGVGAPENTVVFLPEGGDEWWVRDSRFWMASRAFVPAEAEPRRRWVIEPLGTTARRRLTKIFTGALTETGVSPAARGGNSATYLLIMPIETHCHAVRLLFANHRSDVDLRICSASVYPSTGYGGAFEMHAHRLGASDGLPVRVGPTGNSKRAVITFDSAGQDDSLVRARGRRRDFRVCGVAANVDNVRVPYDIVCSDFVPLTTLARTDGGSQPLLFIYVHVEAYGLGRWVAPAYQPDRWCDNNKENRGRMLFGGIAAQSDIDLTRDPSAGLFVGISGGPVFGVQYLSQVLGHVVVLSGDSLTTSPSSDNYSCAIMRAACDLSRPGRPIEVANLGWGGAPSSVYGPLLDRHLDLLEPSILALQPLSRNDGSSVEALQGLMAQGLGRFEAARRRFGTLPVWFSPGCVPSWSDDPEAARGFQALRLLLAAEVIPDVDAPAIIGQDESPWQYRGEMTDDGIHPNDRGVEALVPRAREVLEQILLRG